MLESFVLLMLLASLLGDTTTEVGARLTGIGSGKTGMNVHEQTRRLRDDNLRQPYVVGVTSYNPAGSDSSLLALLFSST